ncbi:unnamed protein product [Sphagnum jensenii]|uniref:NB-ARC domain-containing protein n=1 Tax=Sphagnum jensenii TaxID=128206 RepID=A0ABP1B562_9BRYO
MKTKKKILLGTKKKRRRGVSPPSSRALRSVRDWPVHQLWPLLGDTRRTDLDIVFFHGLQLTANDSRNAWFTTWTERDRDHVCWPQKWLPDDLGQAVRVFSVSYNTHVELCPHDHVSEIADNLFQIFVGSRYKWQHPIVLVGHSIGGLVLKSLVLKLKRGSTIRSPSDPYSEVASKRAKAFLKNLSGVAFYAVPHAGSINFHTFVNKLLKCPDRPCLGIMENIKPYRRDMNQLSVDFDDIVNENKINIYAFSEGKPMDQEQEVLVEFSSAQQLARNFCYKVEDANHMEVCKPPSKGHPSYGLLLQFINDCHEVSRKFEEALQEVRDLRLSTFGMEFELQTVERLLTSSGDDVAPKYVRVCGMGGVGKTRFLEILYASSKVHDHFRGVQFIRRSLGHKPDILSVYRSLSVEFDLEPNLYLNEKEYKPILLSLFKQRRVFLVIDDVWKEQAFNALDLAQGKGSVTLFSTRDQSLFKRASSQISEVHLTTLSEKESWSLFCVNAFAPGCNVPFDLVELSKSMAAECQGLPLALKVIGGAMRGKISPELEWEPQLNKLRASWEGLVPERYGGNPRADAFTLLKKLWEKSFIESNRQFDSDECHLLNFKVHDVMRDLAFHVLEKDCGQLYLYRPGSSSAVAVQPTSTSA